MTISPLARPITCPIALGSAALLTALAGCSGSSGNGSGDAIDPGPDPDPDPDAVIVDDASGFDFPEPVRVDYGAAVFDMDSAIITNPWLALRVGRRTVHEGETEEGLERVELEVLPEIRVVDGVRCAVVLDRAIIDGELVEETWDWFAEDVEGNVWYMGEDSNDYEDGVVVSTAGSWEAGLDILDLGTLAEGGIQMYADPMLGQAYYQEYYEGEAIDAAEIVDVAAPITLGDGSAHVTLRVREWNPYAPDGFEYKYFASNVGLVRETDEDGEEAIELVSEQD